MRFLNIVCNDWKKNDAELWSHTLMLHKPETLDKIYNLLTANNSQKKKKMIIAMFLNMH